jgi:hypothetical protein
MTHKEVREREKTTTSQNIDNSQRLVLMKMMDSNKKKNDKLVKDYFKSVIEWAKFYGK